MTGNTHDTNLPAIGASAAHDMSSADLMSLTSYIADLESPLLATTR